MKESEKNEPGFLITDVYGLSGFKKLGLSAADACALLRECAKYGIDAVAVAELSQKAGTKKPDEIKKSFSGLKGTLENIGKGRFSPWAPPKPIFANFGLPAMVVRMLMVGEKAGRGLYFRNPSYLCPYVS